MDLTVRVVSDAKRCVPVGGGRFALRPVGGRFSLPQLELGRAGDGPPPRLVAFRAGSSSPSGALADAVLAAWSATAPEPQVIDRPVRSTAGSAIDARLVASAGNRPIVVTWHGSYAVEPNPPEEFEVTVELNFQQTTKEPVSVSHPGFVAIDFGTSNSTVVLFDQDKLYTRPLAGRQAARLRDDLIALLEDPTVPAESTGQFTDLIERIARSVSTGRTVGDPRDQLAAALRDESLADPHRDPDQLYAVLLGLERELSSRRQPLRSWLTTKLHRCYDAAFAVPSLDGLQLFPVELDPVTGSHEVPSRIEVTQVSPLRVRMTTDDGRLADSSSAGARQILFGLKQYLGKPEPREISGDGSDRGTVDTDQLIAAALGFLVDQSNAYVELNPRMLGRGRLNHAVITYPTVAPPAVRQRLRELLLDPSGGPGLAQVNASYDEAIAAVMFFLMRDFGGEYEVGVEAVKSRYRAVGEKAWAQNILVIDIGGGTTDIALVTMTLKDQTPEEPRADPRWFGRYYVLTPQVRGSTGHLQLGGEYLTLRVFRWLKAAVADVLLTHAPEQYKQKINALPKRYRAESEYRSGSLVEAVLADPDGAKGTTLGVVEDIAPTRWRDNPANEQAFWLLWQLADRAKLALGAPAAATFPISATEVRQVVNAIATAAAGPAADLPELPDPALELAVEPFMQLVREPLAEVMRLATNLVLDRFAADQTEKLDRIILTGKTSALTQVRDALRDDFGFIKGRDGRVRWNSAGVTVERDYSKLATAIGACWAESIRQFTFDPDGARRRLREGKTVLDVDVNNLFFNLPCTFALEELAGFGERLKVGTELFQLDEQPIGKARSSWDPLSETVSVHRMIDSRDGTLWGNFKFREYAQTQTPPLQLDETIWNTDSDGSDSQGKIKAQLEVTHDLDLSIMLCRGEPHYIPVGPSIDVLAAIREAFGPDQCGEDDTLPEALPGDIMVDSLTAGSTTRGNTVVFEANKTLEFDKIFFDSDDEAATPTPGIVSPYGLEFPANRRAYGPVGGWTFTLRFPGGEKTIGTLQRPVLSGGNFPTRYSATLDRRGNLRVHAGDLPYRKAETLVDVERPGRVFTVKVPPAQPAHDENRNPFNGTH